MNKKEFTELRKREKDAWTFKMPLCYYKLELRNYYEGYRDGEESRNLNKLISDKFKKLHGQIIKI